MAVAIMRTQCYRIVMFFVLCITHAQGTSCKLHPFPTQSVLFPVLWDVALRDKGWKFDHKFYGHFFMGNLTVYPMLSIIKR